MRFIPHSYQNRAIDFVLNHPHCALFLDMGLGKTVSTLTALSMLLDSGEAERILVVAPKKVAESTWSTECEKWDHLRHLRVSRVMGTESQRFKALEADADIYVIGRDSFQWLQTHLLGWSFDTVVLDELTSFKTTSSKRFKAFKRVRPYMRRVIGLTGTPAPNGLADLFGQLYCIDLGQSLGTSKTRYLSSYFDQVIKNNIPIRISIKKGADKEIFSRIAPVTLTMKAEDYLDLPDMIESTVEVELSRKSRLLYEKFERDHLLGMDTEAKMMAANAAALCNKLSQFANGAVYDEDHNVIHFHDEKLDMLVEQLESAHAGGEHVLLFYQYRHDVSRLLERKELKGMRVAEYNGDEDLRRWNAGEVDVLIAHPASTAYGLNLQDGGRVVIWYGTGWNAEQYLQGNARLHRQGQTLPVSVIRIVVKDTVDETAARAVDGKINTQDAMMSALKAIASRHNITRFK